VTGRLLLAFVEGVAPGAFYFGTLWLVVRRLGRLARPAFWLGVTGILRLAVVLGFFALLVGGRWEAVVAALVGFLAMRVVLTRWIGLTGGLRPAAAALPRRGGGAG
jgi:F1F0 ATPase subunit 2